MTKKPQKLNYHRYPQQVADRYGMAIAALLNHFAFWYKRIKSEDHQFFEGDYWVRMKLEKLQSYFTYLTIEQLRHILRKMIAENLIKKSEFNDQKTDRTKWYTLTSLSKEILQLNDEKVSVKSNSHTTVKSNTQSVKNHDSIYKEEDKTKEDNIYTGGFSFLQKLYPVEIETWLSQNKNSITDFDRFLEYYEIVVQQEAIPFTFNKLFGRLRKLRFNWKGSKTNRAEEELQPIIKRRRIG